MRVEVLPENCPVCGASGGLPCVGALGGFLSQWEQHRERTQPVPPEDDPVEQCEECGALVQDTPEFDQVCWRCGEAL